MSGSGLSSAANDVAAGWQLNGSKLAGREKGIFEEMGYVPWFFAPGSAIIWRF